MIQIIRKLVRRRSSEGAVDGFAGGALRGWACLADHRLDEPPLRIEVSAHGRLLISTDASAFRLDLEIASKRAGYCGFTIALDPIPEPGTLLTVMAVLPNGQRCAVPGSPITVPVSMPQKSQEPDQERDVDILPLPIVSSDMRGSLDQCGPTQIRGWAHWVDDTNGSIWLSLCEQDREVVRWCANHWRADLAELRDGDGYCGFELPLPSELRDGRLHVLDLRRCDTGNSVLSSPFRMHARQMQPVFVARQRSPSPLERRSTDRPVSLSIIVNFYNMQREAARTLRSLTRSYQKDSHDFTYEVICIDNGSSTPLDPDWIASFGPEFRLMRPGRQLSSPCAAINEAALQAHGDYLAIMIDGAHLLTPGVFREARQAWREHPDAVVAIRHWFVGGDQRWLAVAGYTQQMEDQLFERIHWPDHGYELFRIGAPIGENPEPWLEGMSESNCLMLPTPLYDRIGGMDEAFKQPGGGFANLDLWQRSSIAADGPLICLIGEASFHQFHGGTTTNIEDAEKDARVRVYANEYRTLRGEEFAGVSPARLQFRGSLPTEFAKGVRQRSLLPLRLAITEQIRPGQLSLHLDDGAQSYVQSVYAECGLQQDVTWMGQHVGVAPSDLISLQQIIHQLRPDAIIVAGAEAGLIRFIACVLEALNEHGTRILHVQPVTTDTFSPCVTALRTEVNAPHTLATVRQWTGSAETVLVLYAANGSAAFSLASIEAYAALVSYRSFLVCLGTVFGQPWLGYSNRRPLQTIRDFVRNNPSFVIDRSWHRQLISTCPSGYLRKVGNPVTAADYDAALDEFDLESHHQEKVP